MRALNRFGCVALVVLGTGALMGADVRGIDAVQGPQADNVALVGNPLIYGVAEADGAAPGNLTAGNSAQLRTDKQGRVLVRTDHSFSFQCNVNAATATAQCQAAPGASLSLYVTDVLLSNNSTTASVLSIVYGTGTNCGTGKTQVTPLMGTGSNATNVGTLPLVALHTPFKVPANNAVCCATAGTTSFGCLVLGYTAP